MSNEKECFILRLNNKIIRNKARLPQAHGSTNPVVLAGVTVRWSKRKEESRPWINIITFQVNSY